MPSLAETQGQFRRAIAGGAADGLLPMLRASGDPLERIEIYRRHYRESFRRHLRGRYPTVEWLVGTDRMIELADALLAAEPPRAPSLAEYGEGLARLIASRRGGLPAWLGDVATLDWLLGCLSVEVERTPLAIEALAALPEADPIALRLTLQPGLAYVQSGWPVDQLIHLRLAGDAPARLHFEAERVHLELRGGRGRFSLQRIDAATYAFRRALSEGRSLGAATERALGAAPAFDLSVALARLFAEGLVTAIPANEEPNHD